MKKDFIFGVATSSYQIEGTHGIVHSIWDTFCEEPGNIKDMSNGTFAIDHLHNADEDIKLIKDLGVDSYRLSISWARVIPTKNTISKEGITFYKNLLIKLKQQNIKPSITLYHWDMPQWVMDETGGFINHKCVNYFLEYAKVVFKELEGLFNYVTTINEPFCVSAVSYLYGAHAPGEKDEQLFVQSQYYTLLAHGVVADYYKNTYFNHNIGIVLNLWFDYSDKYDDLSKKAIKASDLFHNLIYLEPIFKGQYPIEYLDFLDKHNIDRSFMKQEELDIMRTELGFLGINYYTRNYVTYNEENKMKWAPLPAVYDTTEMGWEVYPQALKELPQRLRKDYTTIPVFITENGAAYNDKLENNKVHDEDRITYFKKHLAIIEEVSDELNIVGYYAWSLVDNFEWAHGYTKRFGLVYVDYETNKRIKKDSYHYYKNYIKHSKK